MIKHPPNCKYLTTCIIYLIRTAVFKILEQGLTGQRLPSSTLTYPTTVGNKQLFISPCVDHKNQRTKELPHIAIKEVASTY